MNCPKCKDYCIIPSIDYSFYGCITCGYVFDKDGKEVK